MESNGTALLITAVSLGLVHTLVGPDHYVPFIAMSRAGKWSAGKTALITFLCGIGHVGSSVVLGLIGVAVGMAVGKLEAFESVRGDIAAWLLLAFGLTYTVWGIWRALRNRPHGHAHTHGPKGEHAHEHAHHHDHAHAHAAADSASMTPWVLFTIFVFGPCEVLIPLVMYPAARHNMPMVVLVAAAFGIATISTMMAVVMASWHGLERLPVRRLERYSHALAGFAILMCGVAIKFLGL